MPKICAEERRKRSMRKWFKDVTTIEELRKRYRELLKMYHPDNENGSVEIAQEINSEFDSVFTYFKGKSNADYQSSTKDEKAENEAFKEVLERIIHINADIEIVGDWIWIEKGSYEYRELLKSIGFQYASRKKAWYWHFGEYHRRSKKEISLDEIRQKYGSQKVNHRAKQYVLN